MAQLTGQVFGQVVNSPVVTGDNNNVNINQTIVHSKVVNRQGSAQLDAARALTQEIREMFDFYTDKQAERAVSKGDFQVAAAIYRSQLEKLESLKMDASDIYLKLADREINYDPDLSINTLKKAAKAYPGSLAVIIDMARSYLQLGYTKLAIKLCSENLPVIDRNGGAESKYLIRLIYALAAAQDRNHELLISLESQVIGAFYDLALGERRKYAEDQTLVLHAALLAHVELEGVGNLPVNHLYTHIREYYSPAEDLYLKVGVGDIYVILSTGKYGVIVNSEASSRVRPLEKGVSKIGEMMKYIWEVGDIPDSVGGQLSDVLKNKPSAERMQVVEDIVNSALLRLPACRDCPIRLLAELDVYRKQSKYYVGISDPYLAYHFLRRAYYLAGRLVEVNGATRRGLALKASILMEIGDVRNMFRTEMAFDLHFFPPEDNYIGAANLFNESKNGMSVTYVGLAMMADSLSRSSRDFSLNDESVPFNLCLASLMYSKRVLKSPAYRSAVFDVYKQCSLRVLANLAVLEKFDLKRADQLLLQGSDFLSTIELYRVPLNEGQVAFKEGLAHDLLNLYAERALLMDQE